MAKKHLEQYDKNGNRIDIYLNDDEVMVGNKTLALKLDEMEDAIPEVSEWAEQENPPTYTVSDIIYAAGITLLQKLNAMDTQISQGGGSITQQDIDDAVAAAVAALVDSAPGTLDTLNELAAALGNDANFATTIANALATKISGIKANGASETLPVDQDGIVTLPPAASPISPATNAPIMDGTAGVGSSDKYAREDHVHPHDTTKQDTLTFDSVPTAGHTTQVMSSDKIKTALDNLLQNLTIGQNGNWYVGQTDTGVKAQGPQGNVQVDGNGNVLIYNGRDQTTPGSALDATQGKELQDEIDALFDNTNDADFEIADEIGNVIVRFAGGHIQTQNFNSYTAFNNYYNKSQTESLILSAKNEAVEEASKPLHLRILVIGNSFGCDSFAYVPFILKNYGITCTIHILYKGGATIDDQITNFTSTVNTLYKIDTRTDTAWSSTSSVSAKATLDANEYDIIAMQTGSSVVIDPASYANFGTLIGLVLDECAKAVKLAWIITHTRYGTENGVNYDNPTAVLQNAEALYGAHPIDLVFPYGTAVFDARQNQTLAAIGGGGNLWSSDKWHLQEGLPCYVAALANVQALFDKFYPEFSVMGDTYIPNASETISGQENGNVTGVTDANRRLAQKCAIMANKFKFTIKSI